MNIPEIINDVKQGPRSESAIPVQATGRPPGNDNGVKVPSDAVNRHSETDSKQSRQFSRESVDNLVAEMEDQLAANKVQLKFNVLEENNTIQVEILDSDGNTIRKIPGDDLVKLSKSLKNLDRGFLDKIS